MGKRLELKDIEILGKIHRVRAVSSALVKDIEDENIKCLFEEFDKILNAHTYPESVKIYLLNSQFDKNQVDMVIVCDHFEEGGVVELHRISEFLYYLGHIFGCRDVMVELLDTFWEKLSIIAYDAPIKMPKSDTFKKLEWKNVRALCPVSDACAIKAIQDNTIDTNAPRFKHLRKKYSYLSELVREKDLNERMDF